MKYTPGADRSPVSRKLAELTREARANGGDANIGGPTTAVEVKRLEQVNGIPAIVAALLAMLAVVAVGHALVTSVRRRRRELALLKTIGFNHRQLGATVAWQGAANSLGVATVVTVPTAALILTALGAFALVNLVAFFPARAAARTPPAIALRSE